MLGIAFDGPEENRAWAEELGLDIPLLTDRDHDVAAAYEADRDPDDRFYGYPRRLTYVIDPQGRIAKAYEVAQDQITAHPAAVACDLERLRSEP